MTKEKNASSPTVLVVTMIMVINRQANSSTKHQKARTNYVLRVGKRPSRLGRNFFLLLLFCGALMLRQNLAIFWNKYLIRSSKPLANFWRRLRWALERIRHISCWKPSYGKLKTFTQGFVPGINPLNSSQTCTYKHLNNRSGNARLNSLNRSLCSEYKFILKSLLVTSAIKFNKPLK